MTISEGAQLPDANLSRVGDAGPEFIQLSSLSKDKRIVLFGLPGAFTRTCSAAHLPSFIRTAKAFRAKGVDHIICLSVNDPFVMAAWAKDLETDAVGIEMWADGASEFTKAAGLDFSAPQVGFVDRCKRFSAYVVDNKVIQLNLETKSGVCDFTAGETLLDQI